jgi:hypothetical protein
VAEQLSLFEEPPEPEDDLDGYGPYGPLKFVPAHPLVILRWNAELEMVTSEWPELKLMGSFKDWPTALELVLHQNNAQASVRVRW